MSLVLASIYRRVEDVRNMVCRDQRGNVWSPDDPACRRPPAPTIVVRARSSPAVLIVCLLDAFFFRLRYA
jgi:hypothetical protein